MSDIKRGILAGLEDIDNISEFVIKDIEIDKLIPNSKNFYRVENTNIDELAEDIRENGLYHNLVVRKLGNDKYEIISGERRYQAIKNLGWGKAPCKVIEENEVDSEIKLIQANARTRELTEVEKAKQVERLIELYKIKRENGEIKGKTREIIGKHLNISPTQVASYQQVNNNLIPQLKELFEQEKLILSNAAEFATLSQDNQLKIYDILSNKINLTKEEARNLKKELMKKEAELKLEKEKIEEKNNELDAIKESMKTLKKEIKTSVANDKDEKLKKLKERYDLLQDKKSKLELEHKKLKEQTKDKEKKNNLENIENIKFNTEFSVLTKNLNKLSNEFIAKLNEVSNFSLNEESKDSISDYAKNIQQISDILEKMFVS